MEQKKSHWKIEMPARTRNQNMLDDNFQVTYQVGNNLTEMLTCKYLSQRLFKAELQNTNKDPCPICLEQVNCMHCATYFQKCGHGPLHLQCCLELEQCPICRS